ncbi:hypothetical protein [Nonomuraea polychroma]|uniref:hypothetical protein n=1 Tax=Nonomuraea polychroma TaxID=46176 RepID=UPI001F4EC4F1|nr:hypothetical protein [Nonomuraea polychroma]
MGRRPLVQVPPVAGGAPGRGLELDLRPTGTGTDLDVHFRITDSAVEYADFIAGIEIGFGQSLDKLAATLAAGTHSTNTRSTK